METSKLVNVAQILINTLKEHKQRDTYFLFKPDEAHFLLRCLDMFYTGKNTLDVSIWDKAGTIALQVRYKTTFNVDRPLINLLQCQKDELVETLHLTSKLQPIPQVYRDLMINNFN